MIGKPARAAKKPETHAAISTGRREGMTRDMMFAGAVNGAEPDPSRQAQRYRLPSHGMEVNLRALLCTIPASAPC
jgi:hypothetical protein